MFDEPAAVFALRQDPFYNEEESVKKSPYHKIPLRTMPKTCRKEDYDEVYYGADGAFAVSSKRNIKIIAEPG